MSVARVTPMVRTGLKQRLRRGMVLSGALVLFTLVSTSPVIAQRGSDRGNRSPQERAEMEQRFRRQMARMMQQRLGLTDEQSEQLSAVVAEFDGRRRELRRAEGAARRAVESLVSEERDDQAEAQQLLSRLVELRDEENALFREEQASLLQVLSPVQVLQLQSLREQLGRRIRSLRGRGDDPGGRPRGSEGSTRRPGGGLSH